MKYSNSFEPLPQGFVPGPTDVVIVSKVWAKMRFGFFSRSRCTYNNNWLLIRPFRPFQGKGKRFYNHHGNNYLRELAASMLDDYEMAKTKLDKSLLISDVVESVRTNGSFVKLGSSSGGWVYAEELLVREKVSAVFRDAVQQEKRRRLCLRINKDKQERPCANTPKDLSQPQCINMGLPCPPPITFSFDFGAPLTTDKQPEPEHVQSSVSPKKRLDSWAAGVLLSTLSETFSDLEDDGNPYEPRPIGLSV